MTRTDGAGPLAPVRVLVPRLPDAAALLVHLRRIDANRVYSNGGPLHAEFAEGLGRLTGAGGVALTCNGTAAIELALRARALPGRRRCLMPSFTFIASAHAVCNARLEPFLLDVDPATLALTPAIAEAGLRLLPDPPAAVLVVSAFGAPPDIAGWAAFEARHGIPVVFDAAAALTGLRGVGDQPLCVSLHATKVLGVGEGGAILTADPGFARSSQSMAGFGFNGSERLSAVRGGNYRMSEYAAAVGLAALDGLPERLATLRAIVAGYRDRMAGGRCRLQEGVGVDWDSMTLNCIVPAGDVSETIERLDRGGIEWRRWWGLGTHRHPAFADVPRASLSVTDELAPRVIGVPFHDLLTDDDLDRVTACLA